MKNCERCGAFDECEKCVEGFVYDGGRHNCVREEVPPPRVSERIKTEKRPEITESRVSIQKTICLRGSYLSDNYC
jgi:hypothetical protein